MASPTGKMARSPYSPYGTYGGAPMIDNDI